MKTPKTSLQESLFDKDLVEKGAPIDFEALRDMLFDFGRRKAKMFDKVDVIYHEGIQSIFVKKFVGKNESVCFDLEFGVTNMYSHGQVTNAGFNTPQLRVHDRMMSTTSWSSSRADINATSRQMIKKIPGLEDNRKFTAGVDFEATEDNIVKMFELYNGMLEQFCSKEFENSLNNYVEKFEQKHSLPGIIMDILMKQLITKA